MWKFLLPKLCSTKLLFHKKIFLCPAPLKAFVSCGNVPLPGSQIVKKKAFPLSRSIFFENRFVSWGNFPLSRSFCNIKLLLKSFCFMQKISSAQRLSRKKNFPASPIKKGKFNFLRQNRRKNSKKCLFGFASRKKISPPPRLAAGGDF